MVIISGQRASGRTSALVFEAINTALNEGNSSSVILVRNASQQRYVKEKVVQSMKNLNVISRIENTVINFKNGSRIHFLDGVGARHIRGMSFDKVFVDEPDDILEKVINNYKALHPETKITITVLEE